MNTMRFVKRFRSGGVGRLLIAADSHRLPTADFHWRGSRPPFGKSSTGRNAASKDGRTDSTAVPNLYRSSLKEHASVGHFFPTSCLKLFERKKTRPSRKP
jgi:hypothetical protein